MYALYIYFFNCKVVSGGRLSKPVILQLAVFHLEFTSKQRRAMRSGQDRIGLFVYSVSNIHFI